jgi:hypothetical protein
VKAVDSGAKFHFDSTTTMVANLPAAALGLEYEFFVKQAAGSGNGHLIHPPTGVKLYAKGFTVAAGKGALNTQATSAVGDGFYVWSDGVDYFGFADAGTWAREA